jgi:hypothetical protein
MRRSILLVFVVLWAKEASAQRFGLWPKGESESLRLTRHDLQVNIHHPVAETVLTQEFENPEPLALEAFFHYPVPAGATVVGLALWVNGVRREARMLERQQAREIYEGIVREKRDPALLERVDGNSFRIRIFPVPAKSRQRVELRFVQTVEGDGPGRYRFTIRRPTDQVIPCLHLGVRLTAPFALAATQLEGYRGRLAFDGQAHVLTMGAAERSFKTDLHLRYAAAAPLSRPAAAIFDHGPHRLFVAEIPTREQAPGPRRIALLLDSSRSMERHLGSARALASKILEQLAAEDQVAVVPFDLLPRQKVTLAPLGPVALERARRTLFAARPHDGTAFAPAFEQALAAGAHHVICLTDGGDRFDQEELEYVARLIFDRPGATASVVAMPGSGQEERLTDIARVGGGIYQRLDSGTDLSALATRLASLSREEVPELVGGGALHVVRREATRLLVTGAVQAADEKRPSQVTLRASGQPVPLELPAALQVPGVRGLFAAAEIEARMRRIKLFGEVPEVREEVVRLSVQHNVLSEYTALLATETDADYLRQTSGQKWQRTRNRVEDELPSASFQSTPEPHEYALLALALMCLVVAKRRGWLPAQ